MVPERFTVLFGDPGAAPWHTVAAELLAPQGVRAVTAHTGRDALARIEQGDIHVAVLDQDLPQLTGLQVAKRLRDLDAPPPTILLSRDTGRHLLHEALGLRVFSVLSKPPDLNLLLGTLARVLHRKYADKWPT